MKIMTIPQLQQWQDRGEQFLLVNVMNEDEFQRGHIPGSINIPSGDHSFGERIATITESRVRPVVVYGSRHDSPTSPQAGLRLEKEGFAEVYNLGAGLDGWAGEGLMVEKSPIPETAHS
jgi:rhodanese-related sulfurtransferase